MSGQFAGAIGEGMADTVAIYINGDDAVAEYSNNRASGIRRARYTKYPNTYSDVLGTSVHNDGEIYAATMWRLRELWLAIRSHAGPALELRHRRHELHAVRSRVRRHARRHPRRDADSGRGLRGLGSVRAIRHRRRRRWPREPFQRDRVVYQAGGVQRAAEHRSDGTITAPANGSSFAQGTSVTFTGSGSDLEQGNLTGSLVWTSNIQPGGTIGAGGSFSRSDLIVGTHTITASVTDAGGLTDTDIRTITITAAPAPTITLTTSGFKVKGVRNVDLTWTPTGGGTVDVYLGSSIVATTPNDGAHTYVIGGKGAGSFTFKVCQTGTTVCSNTSTVNF